MSDNRILKESQWNGLPVVIMGTSGISKEVKTIIDEINELSYVNQFNLLGFVAENEGDIGKKILDNIVVTSDSKIEEFFQEYVQIGVIIPIGIPQIKKKIYNKLRKYKNVVYPNIISPTAKIMNKNTVKFGQGNIVCSGVIITEEITIGNFNLINLNTTIGHEVNIGNYCVINPLSSISGAVKIENEVLCGAGTVIKQGIKIKNNSIIGLGAFVVKDIEEGQIMVCKPADKLIK